MNAIGKLISFEGIECCGKGTQIKLAQSWLQERGHRVVVEHEPGGTYYGEALRGILKNPELTLPAIFKALSQHSDYPQIASFLTDTSFDYQRTPRFEMFLFWASRSLYAEKIKALLADGNIVLSDRLMDSTTAYQGGGGANGDKQVIEQINFGNHLAMGEIWPDLTICLDITIDEMYQRMAKENDEKNAFFEKKYDRQYYQRVRNQYLKLAIDEPQRFKVIDGIGPISHIHENITTLIDPIINN